MGGWPPLVVAFQHYYDDDHTDDHYDYDDYYDDYHNDELMTVIQGGRVASPCGGVPALL